MLEEIERWIAKQAKPLSRSSAIRELIRLGLLK